MDFVVSHVMVVLVSPSTCGGVREQQSEPSVDFNVEVLSVNSEQTEAAARCQSECLSDALCSAAGRHRGNLRAARLFKGVLLPLS